MNLSTDADSRTETYIYIYFFLAIQFFLEGVELFFGRGVLGGSVVRLYPKESVEGGDTLLRGSVTAPEGFFEGKPEAAKPRAHTVL